LNGENPYRRWKLTLAYDGTGFKGWERQAQGERTVQGAIEEVIASLTGEAAKVVGASRTDSGVHALGQVAAVDLPARWIARDLGRGLNALSPPDLRIVDVCEVDEGFHPRYSARSKTYFYQLVEGAFDDPFKSRYAVRLPVLPDREAMRAAAALLLGKRDFSALMAAGSSVKTTVRDLSRIRVRWGRGQLRIFFTADGFLYRMVRNMMSMIVRIADGSLAPEKAEVILESGQRPLAPPTFPAKGLFLWNVHFGKGG